MPHIPEFPPDYRKDWAPGKPFKEPPLPRFILDSPFTWIEKPEYSSAYQETASKYGSWETKMAAVFTPEGNVEELKRRAEALHARLPIAATA